MLKALYATTLGLALAAAPGIPGQGRDRPFLES